jgi:hypothetical protein
VNGADSDHDTEVDGVDVNQGLSDSSMETDSDLDVIKEEESDGYSMAGMTVEQMAILNNQISDRKDQYRGKVGEYAPEGDRSLLVENYDEKMRYIKDLLANEAKHQSDSIEAKMAARRSKRRNADEKAHEKNADRLGKLHELKEERHDLSKTAASKMNMADEEKRLKLEMEQAKKEATLKLENQKNQKLQEMRNELLGRLKNATSEQEKAAILEELQRKQKSIEQEMDDD